MCTKVELVSDKFLNMQKTKNKKKLSATCYVEPAKRVLLWLSGRALH